MDCGFLTRLATLVLELGWASICDTSVDKRLLTDNADRGSEEVEMDTDGEL